MDDLSDLEKRIHRLEDIEAIKRLKAKYWNSVDRKDWDRLAECLAEDCTFDTPQLKAMQGRDFIVKVLQRAMRDVKTAHQGHNPEIEILTETTAAGRWALNDRVEIQGGKSFSGYGHYDEEYAKENGAWKICKSRLTYLFQENPS
jgi:ketosteroid isomerase-like protein